ncbi:DUF2911 domain-containing protein [Tenacibaculum sp. SG-28]|uniref:DUF2911 domain-containing protein n=1 Tax=Tenacibaculum sp. SG-28 TaxID=754426 RepID=UPI000CF44FA6|nr:DUF2911 domain-containing protein [Tenacibaculum sp. SG-28]PQJ21716.1 asparagine synthetase B [Tenacibaculum sp. SG-28]
MKKLLLTFVIVCLSLTSSLSAQNFAGLDKSPMDAAAFPSSYRVSDKTVKIIYSRPQLKNRSISKLAPSGKIWRTGANEAPEITFYTDVNFGGKAVKAGTYTLFTIPGDKEWTIILSTAKNVWGSYFYKESEDVVRVQGTVSNLAKKVEAFSISFDGKNEDFNMFMGWGNTLITVPIKE